LTKWISWASGNIGSLPSCGAINTSQVGRRWAFPRTIRQVAACGVNQAEVHMRKNDFVITPKLMMLQNREGADPKSNLARNVLNSLGKTILAEYFRSAQDCRARSRLPTAIQRAKDALDERFLYPWTVDKLAQIAGMNANYLIHLFKAHLGMPPIHYLWERRLNVGIHILQTTGLSIEEISFRSGFQSAAHFSRRIKQRSGLSPIQLRLQGL
jgi:AraC-like DNA-binding protein